MHIKLRILCFLSFLKQLDPLLDLTSKNPYPYKTHSHQGGWKWTSTLSLLIFRVCLFQQIEVEKIVRGEKEKKNIGKKHIDGGHTQNCFHTDLCRKRVENSFLCWKVTNTLPFKLQVAFFLFVSGCHHFFCYSFHFYVLFFVFLFWHHVIFFYYIMNIFFLGILEILI